MEDIQDRQEEINLKEKEKEILKVRVKEFEALLNVATAAVNELETGIYKLQTEASSIEDRTGSVETKKNELSVVSNMRSGIPKSAFRILTQNNICVIQKTKRLEIVLGKLLNTRDGMKKELDEHTANLKRKMTEKYGKTQRIETTR